MKWISIKDKMPPESVTIFIAEYYSDGDSDGDYYYNEAIFDGGFFYWPHHCVRYRETFDYVTHWMIPEEPEGL